MVSNKIMSRRKRAQIGTILAVLMILLPLPVGAYIVGNMNDYGVQQYVYDVNDVPSDSIFDSDCVTYDNTTEEYTYSKYLNDGETLLANYTSDVAYLRFRYSNESSNVMDSSLSWTESDGKIFTMFEQDDLDGDDTLTFGTAVGETHSPRVALITATSPKDVLDAGVTSVNAYFENGQETNITVMLGVYDQDGIPIPTAAFDNGVASATQYVYDQKDVTVSSNGTTVTFDLEASDILTAASQYPDGYVFVQYRQTGLEPAVSETNGIFLDVQFTGPEKPYSLTSTWNACLIATGLIALLGAVLATPYIGLESLSNDGANGQRYRKGYNPRKNTKSRSSRSSSYKRRK